MDVISILKNCVTYRDLYSLSEEFYKNGLCLTHTNNGTRVLCAIENGDICTDNLFEDYIYIEGKENDLIPDRLREVITVFCDKRKSNNRLHDRTPSYHKNVSLYGKPLSEKRMLEEQQIRYISTFIQD